MKKIRRALSECKGKFVQIFYLNSWIVGRVGLVTEMNVVILYASGCRIDIPLRHVTEFIALDIGYSVSTDEPH